VSDFLLKHSLLLTHTCGSVSEDDLLKHSLLLIHGTVYGQYQPDIDGYYVFPDITTSIENSWATPWRINIPYVGVAANHNMVGTITHNEPIDVISWNAGNGRVSPTGLEIWEQCMTLLMRHV